MSSADIAYICTVTTVVCKDLVLHDSLYHNHFRELISLTHRNPMLLHTIVATSALHMSNAAQALSPKDISPPAEDGQPTVIPSAYYDALMAKQRALCMLRMALNDGAQMPLEITLAVVLLLLEFELIDSGRDSWRQHTKGARALIDRIHASNPSGLVIRSSLSMRLISECLVCVMVSIKPLMHVLICAQIRHSWLSIYTAS